MQFDFTNTSDQGFASIPPGEYAVKVTEWWYRLKEETGNYVIDMDLEITEGEYDGESIRNFHAISIDDNGNPTPKTMGFLLRVLTAFGIVEPDDRGPKGQLKVEFVYGDEDDSGRVEIVAVEVNGDEREIEGREGLAVVAKREDADGTGVRRIEPLTDDDEDDEEEEKPKKGKGRAKATEKAAEKEEPAAKSKGKSKGKRSKVPF